MSVIDPTLQGSVLAATSNRILELIVFPTEQCNFRCVYCYEDFKMGKMKASVVLGIKRLIQKRASELDILKLSWFGGEPLLAKNIVLDISAYANTLSRIYEFQYRGTMTTNGYLLTPDVLEALLKLGVASYQISLDGPHRGHDQTRQRADGQGSFDRILENLIAARDVERAFEIILRIHVHADNQQDIPVLLAQLRQHFAGDPRFKILFKTIFSWAGASDSVKKLAVRKGIAEAIATFEKEIQPDLMIYRADQGVSVCYAAMTNAYAIRSDGRLAKCTVALQDDRNTVGQIDTEGNLQVEVEKLAPWVESLWQGDVVGMGCPWRQISVGAGS